MRWGGCSSEDGKLSSFTNRRTTADTVRAKNCTAFRITLGSTTSKYVPGRLRHVTAHAIPQQPARRSLGHSIHHAHDDTDDHPYDAVDLTTLDATTLFDELASASSWRARCAHNEILRRGPEVSKHAAPGLILDGPVGMPQAGRFLWLAAATAAQGLGNERSSTIEMLETVPKGEDAELAVQAVRATAEYFADDDRAGTIFDRALAHQDPRVQLAGVIGLFKLDRPLPEAVAVGPARSEDTYLRQAATMLLARKATAESLESLCESTDPRTRLAGVLSRRFPADASRRRGASR